MTARCPWCLSDPLYITYHDTEWGKPSFDDHYLFAALCLEGMQAGLSWLTILKRRQHYYDAFAQFDPAVIAQFDQKTIDDLMTNPKLIRHQKKLLAIVTNAKAYLSVTTHQSFSAYLWGIVGTRVVNYPKTISDIPTQTPTAIALAKRLKKDGFSFVGPKSCYALMQAVGMVDDHLSDCPAKIDTTSSY